MHQNWAQYTFQGRHLLYKTNIAKRKNSVFKMWKGDFFFFFKVLGVWNEWSSSSC